MSTNPQASTGSQTQQKGILDKLLDFIEKYGNKLPHPITIFAILAILTIFVSAVAEMGGLSAEFERVVDGEVVTDDVEVQSLLSTEGIRMIFSDAVDNFTSFAPLGTVLVAMIGVGVADNSGLIQTVLRKIVMSAPNKLITMAIVFTGILSNIASNAGYVILIPLGAMIFLSLGRHPLAGITAAFAGVSGGFSANLIIGTLDPLLAGISQEAAQMYQEGYTVDPTANWYFMIASTFVVTFLGTYVTEKIIEPRLGEYKGSSEESIDEITENESKGMKWAGLSLIVYLIIVLALVLPSNGVLRADDGDIIDGSAFMAGIVPIIAVAFLIPGIFFGIATGTVTNDKDVAKQMGKSMSTLGTYICLVFVAAQFIEYFNWSNLGEIIAVYGGNFLETIGLTGIPLAISFVILAGSMNLFITSGSAQWGVMAPIFIPMLMSMGYSPEFIQIGFRIGDSISNLITPLLSFFPFILAYAQRYDEKIGIGTMISSMLPYSITFLIGWSILFIIWFILGLPIGPGASIYL
ncbi:AbgT family transporter [Natranaerobius trueperi]|uniref:Aminobenzoyl-glutamate transporter n=1 Tax=Natranaerobius trueperi TaxID=759412 RepID=A0A226C0M4_9FIRM|nr:AbgT family transporter [Natranaerobius trueperi]OWZ84725.1 aminobenzoyl-glutamate transporter [Natranaerobius trueperi]